MASSSSSSWATRAIKIPDHANGEHRSAGRRRGSRYLNTHVPGSMDSSDAGPSSFGSSDQDASWPGSPSSHGGRLRTTTGAVVSPAHTLRTPNARRADPTAATTTASGSKDKAPVTPSSSHRPSTPPSNTINPLISSSPSPLGPSMQHSTSYKSINLNEYHHHHHGDSDEPPRLITYTKSGQGFTWNDELFLPSYLVRSGRRRKWDGDFGDGEEEGGCPVAEIFITDEEAERMMP